MPTYVIQRNIPGAHQLSPAELRATSQKSNEILETFGGSKVVGIE